MKFHVVLDLSNDEARDLMAALPNVQGGSPEFMAKLERLDAYIRRRCRAQGITAGSPEWCAEEIAR